MQITQPNPIPNGPEEANKAIIKKERLLLVSFFEKFIPLIYYFPDKFSYLFYTKVKASIHLCKKTAIIRSKKLAASFKIPKAIPSKIFEYIYKIS